LDDGGCGFYDEIICLLRDDGLGKIIVPDTLITPKGTYGKDND
jgi:hypothetical protein